jgi:hypothetical protein
MTVASKMHEIPQVKSILLPNQVQNLKKKLFFIQHLKIYNKFFIYRLLLCQLIE